MSRLGRELSAAARLDLGEVVRSRWLQFSSAIYLVLAAAIVFAGMRSSLILGFSGMSRALLSLTHALLVVLPLLALSGTAQVITRAREDGSLELLLSHPLSRASYFVAVSLTRYAAQVLPLLTLLAAMALAARGFGEAIPWAATARSSAISAALLWAFTGLGFAVSVHTHNQARAVVWALALWALGVVLLDLALIGLLLQWQVQPRAVLTLALINPVQTARLALLAGTEPDLGTLGPVGFFATQHLGPQALFWLGLGWPGCVGAGAWLWAFWGFCRGDVL